MRYVRAGANKDRITRHLWLSENLSGFRILIVLRGFYGNARNKACESNEADRYQVVAAPPLMHRKGHAGPRDQQRRQDDHGCGIWSEGFDKPL